jgi:hypothetical protein
VFILSGAEDLVPVLLPDGDGWKPDEFEQEGYRVKRYRPRVEGLFSLIERWTRVSDGDIHWRSITKANVLTVYGVDSNSRISGPGGRHQVFSWLISSSFDDNGNAIVYEYASEDARRVDTSLLEERNRRREANRYPKRVLYGNRTPVDRSDRKDWRTDWMFEIRFDYGEEAAPEDDREPKIWPVRRDCFSRYRSGFEIRTCRLCCRILVFHHFPEELGKDESLVHGTEFEYDEKRIGSFLVKAVQSGYAWHGDHHVKRSLPPLEMAYIPSPLEDPDFEDYKIREVDPGSVANAPGGVGDGYRWAHLDGEGISGILTGQGGAWFYKPNLGRGRFGPVETLATLPSLADTSGSTGSLLDLAGDGDLDVVMLDTVEPGFYGRNSGDGWKPFRNFRSLPNRDFTDPNLWLMDVAGDGLTGVLIIEDENFTWHRPLREEGFGPPHRVPLPIDEEEGPRVLFADPDQSIYLADMSGDGLSDIVRIRNGEICYWPNLGYGRFGGKVNMDQAPWLDARDRFRCVARPPGRY